VKKILTLALLGAGVAAFVGFDVVGASVRGARQSLRTSLSSAVPLKTQLAEARAAVDAYAENVIRGEVAAESLSEAIDQAEREVRTRSVAVERERRALADLRDVLRDGGTMMRPASFGGVEASPAEGEREAVRRARRFEAATAILARRAKDLEALRAERDATLAEVASAKDQQVRLAQEVEVLAAEVQSLEARQSVARTREACRGDSVSCSGYGAAEERIRAIRAAVSEQNKRLRHYAMRDAASEIAVDEFPVTAVEAIDAALGSSEPLN
jgi:hypothetical protein